MNWLERYSTLWLAECYRSHFELSFPAGISHQGSSLSSTWLDSRPYLCTCSPHLYSVGDQRCWVVLSLWYFLDYSLTLYPHTWTDPQSELSMLTLHFTLHQWCDMQEENGKSQQCQYPPGPVMATRLSSTGILVCLANSNIFWATQEPPWYGFYKPNVWPHRWILLCFTEHPYDFCLNNQRSGHTSGLERLDNWRGWSRLGTDWGHGYFE